MCAEGCFRSAARGSIGQQGVAQLQTVTANELHVILDKFVVPPHPAVRAWLAAHPLVHFHYTPPSASWLNQVEGFFGILGKQSLTLTDFPSNQPLPDHLTPSMRPSNN